VTIPVALPGGRARRAGPLLLLLGMVALPIAYPDLYFLHIMVLALINAILVVSLQFLLGHAGQASLGHAAFFGTGAYASAIAAMRAGLPFAAAFLIAAVVAGILGAGLGPIARLRGYYLGIATLAFNQVVVLVLTNWESVTQGPLGIRSIPPPRLGPLVLRTDHQAYYLILAVLAVTCWAYGRLARSRFGRALMAIRENEVAASAMGVNPGRYKLQAFVISAISAGMAGSLFAHVTGYLNPNSFTFQESVALLLMVVVGGQASLWGSAVGAVVLTLAPEYLRFLKDYRLVVYGAIVVVLMMFLPDGLAGAGRWILQRVGRRPPAPIPGTAGPAA